MSSCYVLRVLTMFLSLKPMLALSHDICVSQVARAFQKAAERPPWAFALKTLYSSVFWLDGNVLPLFFVVVVFVFYVLPLLISCWTRFIDWLNNLVVTVKLHECKQKLSLCSQNSHCFYQFYCWHTVTVCKKIFRGN